MKVLNFGLISTIGTTTTTVCRNGETAVLAACRQQYFDEIKRIEKIHPRYDDVRHDKTNVYDDKSRLMTDRIIIS